MIFKGFECYKNVVAGYYSSGVFRQVFDGSSRDKDPTANLGGGQGEGPSATQESQSPDRQTVNAQQVSPRAGIRGKTSSEVPIEQRPVGGGSAS